MCFSKRRLRSSGGSPWQEARLFASPIAAHRFHVSLTAKLNGADHVVPHPYFGILAKLIKTSTHLKRYRLRRTQSLLELRIEDRSAIWSSDVARPIGGIAAAYPA